MPKPAQAVNWGLGFSPEWQPFDGTPYRIAVYVAEDRDRSGYVAMTHDHPDHEWIWSRGFLMEDAIENLRVSIEQQLCQRVEIGPNA